MSSPIELLQEGRYQLTNKFGTTANGSLYDAFDTVRNAKVLIKEIPVRFNKVVTVSQQEQMRNAFANQAKILTEINHPSLMHIHDYFSEVGRQYIVMETVDGEDMLSLMHRNGKPFSVKEVLTWADQLLDGLNYLHTFRPPVIHRNIRPENVRLLPDGRVKLLAFGQTEVDDEGVLNDFAGNVADIGTVRYAPLEQIWGSLDAATQKVIASSHSEASANLLAETPDLRSDIYSFGATLYQLLTATQPNEALARMFEVIDGKPDPLVAPNKINSSIPPEISDVVVKALEINRENRFDSTVIMRQVLRTALVRVKERELHESSQPSFSQPVAPQTPVSSEGTLSAFGLKRQQQKIEQQSPVAAGDSGNLIQQLREAEAKRRAAEDREAALLKLVQERQSGEIPIANTENLQTNGDEAPANEHSTIQLKTVLPEDELLDILLPTDSQHRSLAPDPIEFEPQLVENGFHSTIEPNVQNDFQRISESTSTGDLRIEFQAETDDVHKTFESSVQNIKIDDSMMMASFAAEEATHNVATAQTASTTNYFQDKYNLDLNTDGATDLFSDQIKPQSRFGLKGIAIAASLLITLLVGSYVYFSTGSANVETQVSAQPMPVIQQPTPEVQPEAVQNLQTTQIAEQQQPEIAVETGTTQPDAESSSQSTESSYGSDNSAEMSQPSTKRGSGTIPQKAAKPAAVSAKARVKKKALTVDDLLEN